MKKGTLIFNAIVAVAIIVLFVLHFCAKNNACKNTSAAVGTGNGKNNFRIAYFDMDSVQSNYAFYKEVAKELTESEQKKRSELMNKKNDNANKLKEYQEKGASMSQTDMAKAQQDLAQRDRDYQMAEQMKASEMQDESFKKLHEVKKRIEDYLKDYNKDKGFAYIITNSSEIIYYKDSAYNITNDIIKGLNELYKKK